jgi:ABC-type dipeptide/oligopeptide/nickel transport system permease component
VPLVLATTALTAAMVVIGSLVADLLHAWIDPRLRATTIADG